MNDIRYKRVQTQDALDQVLKTELSEAKFDAYLDQLDGFVAAQLDGDEHEKQFPELAAYLNIDPKLADVYDRLYRLEVDARADKVCVAEFIPESNLSFLDSPLKKLLSEHIKRLKGAISLSFSDDMLSWLQLEPMLSGSALRAVGAKTELYKLEPAEHGIDEWPATITVLSSEDSTGLCTVQVQVAPPGRAFPNLGGIKVTVDIPDVNSYEQETDMLGVATFDNLAMDHLSQMQIIIQE